jgi:hypothetical protein
LSVIISDYNQFGARHPETGALRNVLAHLGIVAPHSRQPYNEELLFGIGGGIGFAYFLFEQRGAHPIHLGTRLHTKETERPEFFQGISSRLSLSLRVQNSSSSTAAAANLKRSLQQRLTPILSVDPSRLPYLGLQAPVYTYYCVVAFGIDDATDQVQLADRCPQAVAAKPEDLRAARETSWSPKYRAVLIERSGGEPDVAEAVRQGIRLGCAQMHGGLGITNFGLRGLEKWAAVLTSTKEKKSWPKIFAPGPLLYEALYSIFAQIRGRSATGNANRAYYADFLDQAADILSNPGLRGAAQSYRKCDEIWGEIADAHLPGSVPPFEEARRLTLRRRELFESKGLDAEREIQQIRGRLREIAEEAGANFPLSAEDVRSLLNDLRQRVLKLRSAEAEALDVLEAAVPPFGEAMPQPQPLTHADSQPQPVGSTD